MKTSKAPRYQRTILALSLAMAVGMTCSLAQADATPYMFRALISGRTPVAPPVPTKGSWSKSSFGIYEVTLPADCTVTASLAGASGLNGKGQSSTGADGGGPGGYGQVTFQTGAEPLEVYVLVGGADMVWDAGGGASAIWTGTSRPTKSDLLVVVGGGGGGGGDDKYGYGGPGGGPNQPGVAGGGSGGGGGTLSSGGASGGGSHQGGFGYGGSGTASSSGTGTSFGAGGLYGGYGGGGGGASGNGTDYGGGGGGGFYGGGGGAVSGAGAGGGGSGFAAPSVKILSAVTGKNGYSGFVDLSWQSNTVQTPK